MANEENKQEPESVTEKRGPNLPPLFTGIPAIDEQRQQARKTEQS